jgi:peptidoglycan hydrolase CwlO-like protein
MGFFTPRERAELGKSAEMRGQGKARELVRHEFTPRARRPADPDISGHVGTLVNRVAASSVQEIDELIVRLQRRRQQLLDERERVQREILAYTALSQSTMQSTKIISESLAQFNKVPDAPRMSDSQVQDVPAAEQHSETAAEQRSETAAEQHSETAAEQRSGETETVAEQRSGADEPPAQHGKDEGAS